MRVRLLMPLLLAAAVSGAEGLEPRFEAGTAFVWGQATELVLRDGTYNDPVSRLVWEVPPSAALSMSLEWPWNSWTSTRLALQGVVPLTQGTVVNEDWDTGSSVNDLVYGKSVSDTRMTAHYSGGIEQVVNLPGFQLFGGGFLRITSWEAWGGTYHYEPVGGADSNGTFSGLVLEYRQTWLIPYVGVSTEWRYEGWSLVPAVRLSPYTWCYDVDNHLFAAKRLTFEDYTRGGLYGQVSFEVSKASERTIWGLRASWEAAWGAIGDTVMTEPQDNTTSSTTFLNAAGAWFHEMSLSLFMRN